MYELYTELLFNADELNGGNYHLPKSDLAFRKMNVK